LLIIGQWFDTVVVASSVCFSALITNLLIRFLSSHFPASPLNDPKDYDFKPNNGTIIQQGLNTGTIKLPGKPYVGNIPQEGKNEGIILYNGKEGTVMIFFSFDCM